MSVKWPLTRNTTLRSEWRYAGSRICWPACPPLRDPKQSSNPDNKHCYQKLFFKATKLLPGLWVCWRKKIWYSSTDKRTVVSHHKQQHSRLTKQFNPTLVSFSINYTTDCDNNSAYLRLIFFIQFCSPDLRRQHWWKKASSSHITYRSKQIASLTWQYRIYSRNSRHCVIHAFNTIFKKIPV